MPRLTEQAHATVRSVLAPGEVAIDATAGNGRDTRFLLECVGERGRVFAFDVQPESLARSARALVGASNVALFTRDHAEMRDAIPSEFHGRVGAVMFNLGYLPGGDHTFTTQPASTLKAIAAALELLRPGGVLTVLAYTRHPGGEEEAEAVAKLLGKQAAVATPQAADVPRLFVVHKPFAIG
jgi:predicted methyltransferase